MLIEFFVMKLKKFELLLSSKHFKNFSTLVFGTVTSQILLVVASPLLTRLFSPEDFGVLSTFTSISVISSIIFSGRYELAIGLPVEEYKAEALMRLIYKLSIISAALIFVLIIIFWFCDFLGIIREDLFSISYFYLPFYVFLTINNSALIYWVNRHKQYRKVSFSTLLSSMFNVVICFFLGFFGVKGVGLVTGLTLGMLASVLFLFMHFIKEKSKLETTNQQIKDVAKEYIYFPKYSLFSDLASNLNQQFLPILFAFFYSSYIVGLFSLANRMLRLPNIVFTTAIANIFRNEAIDQLRIRGNCIKLFTATLKRLFLIGLIVYSSIFILSPYLFGLFFGKEWVRSSEYAQILCVMLFVEFFSQPFNSLYYVSLKQKVFLKVQTIQTIFSIAFVVVLLALKKDVFTILKAYSFISIIFSLLNLYNTFKISKNQNGN